MISKNEPMVIPSQIRKARIGLAIPLGDVASKIGVEPKEVAKWEDGEGEPSIEQLWGLARIYHRSTDYFFRPTSELSEEFSFRLKKERSIEELPIQTREAIVRFDELCRAETELEKILGETRKVLIERVTTRITPEQLAKNERLRLGLGEKPIRNLRSLLARIGIRLFMLPIEQKEFSGMCWWHSEYGPCILVNAYDTPRGRRTFTMAHEYAHLALGQPPVLCDLELDIPDERYANVFATNFLIPASDLEEEFKVIVGISGTLPEYKQLGTLASRYAVSLEAMSRRLEALNLIPRGSTDRYIAEWNQKPRPFRGPKGPRWKRRLGDKFVSLVVDAHVGGHISLGKFARLLGVDVRTASDFSEKQMKTKTGQK